MLSICTLCALFGNAKEFAEPAGGNHLKRVVFLVCLIVSLVELDWERGRIYLLSSIASLLFVLGSELMRLRRVRQASPERAFTTGEGLSSKLTLRPRQIPGSADYYEKVASCTTIPTTRKGLDCLTSRSGNSHIIDAETSSTLRWRLNPDETAESCNARATLVRIWKAYSCSHPHSPIVFAWPKHGAAPLL